MNQKFQDKGRKTTLMEIPAIMETPIQAAIMVINKKKIKIIKFQIKSNKLPIE
jgi:hypothetical protein